MLYVSCIVLFLEHFLFLFLLLFCSFVPFSFSLCSLLLNDMI